MIADWKKKNIEELRGELQERYNVVLEMRRGVQAFFKHTFLIRTARCEDTLTKDEPGSR
jgi:hypothetical protein